MPMDTKDKGAAKIVGGLVLMLAGIAGFVFGRNARGRVLRLAVMIMSAVSFGAGFYLFVDGVEDLAVGTVGQYRIGGAAVQTMTYPGPNFLEMSIRAAQAVEPKRLHALRRLKYQCPDGSKGFTVYVTKWGVFGIPEKTFVCEDGFELLKFDPSQGFVIELPNT